MLDQFIRQKVSDQMNAEQQSSFAMSGYKVEDTNIVPDVDQNLPLEDKVNSILSQMTLEEKIAMLGGEDNLAIRGNARLKLPKVWCSDASAGARCMGRATAFPVPIAMTATWNRELINKSGSTIAEECRAKGVSVLLAPGVNIYRVPTNGRNFEYMGEDPFLAAELVVPYIRGVQEKGVITTVKHFACNNSDYDRHRMNSEVDERTLHEIYLPAFKAAVQKGDSKSVMCAYNPVNGTYASENKYLLNDVLRDTWGFKGFVISDWTCVYSTDGPLKAGLDLEMPYGRWLSEKKIKKQLKKGKLSEADIDRAIGNLLRVFFEMGVYSRPAIDRSYDEYSRAHSDVSLEAAREAIVLLKNESQTLPLAKGEIKRIAVLGFNARNTTTCGGGSCNIKSYDKVNILDAIKAEAGQEIQVSFIEDKRGAIQDSSAVAAADVVIVCAGYSDVEETECFDRSWGLPFGQDQLIRDAARLNPNTVVVLSAGAGVETEPWLKDIPALMHSFYLGENAGTAVADVLFGHVNPSGKLPFTMAKKWFDFEANKYYVKKPDKISLGRILGPQSINGIRKIWSVKYEEKLNVGYRHFDTNNVEPQFPFGFGLSYTSFKISELRLSASSMGQNDELKVSVNIKNSGELNGQEVVQLYIQDLESSLPRPLKELKGFEKVKLAPGESKEVEFSISREHLSFYDDKLHRWIAEPGKFKILVGNSSRNICCEAEFELK